MALRVLLIQFPLLVGAVGDAEDGSLPLLGGLAGTVGAPGSVFEPCWLWQDSLVFLLRVSLTMSGRKQWSRTWSRTRRGRRRRQLNSGGATSHWERVEQRPVPRIQQTGGIDAMLGHCWASVDQQWPNIASIPLVCWGASELYQKQHR